MKTTAAVLNELGADLSDLDFLPVVGQLDDVILTALVLRAVIRSSGGAMTREHWPGPEQSLTLVLRLGGVAAR